MKPQERARYLRQHPAITSQTLPTITRSPPLTIPNFPAFRKWNPVERAKYLQQSHNTPKTKKLPLSTSQTTPRHPPGLSPIPNRPPLSQTLSHSVAPVITGLAVERTLKISVCLHYNQRDYETTAIIDSGATGCFIDTQLAQRLNLETTPLSRPVKAINVDGTANCKGNITQEANVHLSFTDYTDHPHEEIVRLMVLNLGKPQLILGMPWLQKWNPEIDWTRKTIYLPESETPLPQDVEPLRECLPELRENLEPQDHLLQCLGLDVDHEIENLIRE